MGCWVILTNIYYSADVNLNFLYELQEAAQKMMDGIGYEGIIIDGRRILFEYRSDLFSYGCFYHPVYRMRLSVVNILGEIVTENGHLELS